MIVFKSIKYKNFLSTGNKFITHKFVSGQKKLIIGKNGSGKSIVIDALCFALYNKAFRKCKKDQLVNSINKKNLIVELEFDINGKKYKIRRGVKPVFTELYVDGKLKDQDASSYDYQGYIENSVLRMTEKTFRQIVVLGSTAFIPFMRLPAHHRRIVIEDLLEVAIYSNMHDVIKRKSNVMQVEFQNLLNKIKLTQNSIKHKTDALNKLDNSNAGIITDNDAELLSLKSSYALLSDSLTLSNTKTENHLNEIININKHSSTCEEDKFELMDLLSKISLNKTKHEKENVFFKENGRCYVCHQKIEHEFRDHTITINNNKIDEFTRGISQLNNLINSKTTLILDNNASIKALKTEIKAVEILNKDMETNLFQQQHLVTLNVNLKESNTDELLELKNAIKGYNAELASAEASKADYMKTVNSFTYIDKLLKEDGIKSKVIKTYLPIINKLIRKYLDIMQFSIDFRFDEFFNETIKARYKDNFSYGNFSEGQKLRIDLCLLFTWRELSRLKNSAATNLIILDEIGDSSLDIDGFDSFLKILNVDKDKQCAIIISHKPDGIAANVDEISKALMVGNFTQMSSSYPESN